MRCVKPIQLGKNLVPCGKCNFCLEVKRGDWSFRLQQELKVAKSAHFLTLTYATEPLHGLDKTHIQLFHKRLRKEQSKVTTDKLRYYVVGEYGTKTNRAHYHSILFNLHSDIVPDLDRIWSHGHILAGSVTPASIHYVTKYVINRHNAYYNKSPPFRYYVA